MFAISVVGDNQHEELEICSQLANKLTDRGLKVSIMVYHPNDHESVAGKTEMDNALSYSCANFLQFSHLGARLICNGKQSVSKFIPLLEADALIVAGKGRKELDWLPEIVIVDDDTPLAVHDESRVIAYWSKKQNHSVRMEDRLDKLADMVIDMGFALPGLDCGGCGRAGCRELAAEIIARRADPTDCAALNTTLSININGQNVPLNPFVSNLYQATFQAMLSQLKGYNSGNAVITIKV